MSTMWAACFAASEPDAIAMPQSASLIASTSFTPSPTMATVMPAACHALMKACFCSGLTRPKTLYFMTACLKAVGSSGSLVASTYFSAPAMPAFLATLETVSGLSPDRTLIATPDFAKYANVSFASSLITSDMMMAAIGVTAPLSPVSGSMPLDLPRSSTR